MTNIHYLKAFTDNYIWIIQDTCDIVIIDPGEDQLILDYITANNLNLVAILLTHSHNDHIGGVTNILKKYQVPVYAYFALASIKVVEKSQFNLLGCQFEVIYNPGHTMDGVSYLMHDGINSHLFCGDTLFAGGCGRVFTNDYKVMLESLDKLSGVGDNTYVYPGHEYTLKNLQFAKFIEPNNASIQERINEEQDKLEKLGITLPTTIELEHKTNPFLRLDEQSLKIALDSIEEGSCSTRLEYFIKLRKLRNEF